MIYVFSSTCEGRDLFKTNSILFWDQLTCFLTLVTLDPLQRYETLLNLPFGCVVNIEEELGGVRRPPAFETVGVNLEEDGDVETL